MKIIKPAPLGLVSRGYRQQGREWLGIGVAALFDMAAELRLCPEAELWERTGRALAGTPLDLGLPKPDPEYLVAGHVWGGYADAEGAVEVSIRVGERLKTLRVCGLRHWEAGRIGPAQPFETLALDWAHAYGGPELAENRGGMGMVSRDEGGRRDGLPLPQIEYPGQRIVHPGQRGVPAGLMPLPPDHPLRVASFGQPDGSWLEQNFPGFPADMAEDHFNVAPPDQRWTGLPDALQGADFELRHLHPRRARWTGRLPSVRARALIGRQGGAPSEEIDLRLTTVWFLPSTLQGVLIFHGRAGMRCFDAVDVTSLLLALELAGERRDTAHYQEVGAARMKPDPEHAGVPDDHELLPAGLAQAREETPRPLRRGELRQRYQQVAARAAIERGAEAWARHPAGSGQAWLPSLPPLTGVAAQSGPDREVLRQEAGKLRSEAQRQQAMLQSRQADLLTRLADQGGDPAPVQRGLDSSMAGPPVVEVPERLLAAAPSRLPADQVRRQADAARHGLTEAYRAGAQHQPEVAVHSATASSARRLELEQAYREGRSLVGWDLTGLDLAGIDLQGADLSGALLESVDFTGARLDGCTLARAVMVRSRLRHASLRRARLQAANLAGSTLEDSDLADSVWEGCVLDDAVVRRCRLRGSRWRQCSLRRTRLEALDLRQATLADMVLEGLWLCRLQCQGCHVRKLAFVRCQLQEVDFTETDMEGLAMVACEMDHLTRFARSRLVKACFVEGCRFDRPDFRAARLREINWRGAQLRGLSLAGARIRDSDLTDACLAGGDLSGARFERVQMVRIDLADANLEAADLIGAYMRGARLPGASLQQANLFRAHLGEVTTDRHTRLDQAYLERHVPYPLHREEAPG